MNKYISPDPGLTTEQLEQVSRLTNQELENLDAALFQQLGRKWQKAAKVIGIVMMEASSSTSDLPDVFYLQRLAKLVEQGKAISQGDLKYMQFSEVKLP